MKRLMTLGVGAFLAGGGGGGRRPTRRRPTRSSEAAGRRSLDLTVYNQDLALVREST